MGRLGAFFVVALLIVAAGRADAQVSIACTSEQDCPAYAAGCQAMAGSCWFGWLESRCLIWGANGRSIQDTFMCNLACGGGPRECAFTVNCNTYSDCGGDGACLDGWCQPTPECLSDSACGEGRVCSDRTCVDAPPARDPAPSPECISDNDCRSWDEMCNVTAGACIPRCPDGETYVPPIKGRLLPPGRCVPDDALRSCCVQTDRRLPCPRDVGPCPIGADGTTYVCSTTRPSVVGAPNTGYCLQSGSGIPRRP